MACSSSFPSWREENHPDPNSGRDLDLDKPGCVTFYWGNVTDPAFLHTLLDFHPQFPDCCNPKDVESFTWSVSV